MGIRIACLAAFGFAVTAAAAPLPALQPRIGWEWQELDAPPNAPVHSVAFSPDGTLVAAGAKELIQVWSVETGRRVSRMQLPKPETTIRLAFSADGKLLVSEGFTDPTLRTWDVKTGKQEREVKRIQVLSPAPATNSFGALSPGGEYALNQVPANYRNPSRLELISTTDGKVRALATGEPRDLESWYEAAFSPDGKTVACNGSHNRLATFDTATGKLVREFRAVHYIGGWIKGSVRYSPDGKYIAAGEPVGKDGFRDPTLCVVWGANDGLRWFQMQATQSWIGQDNRYLLSDSKSVYDLLTDEKVAIGNAPAEERRLIGMSAGGEMLAFQGGPAAKHAIYLTPAPVLAKPLRPGERLTPEVAQQMWTGVLADNLFRRSHCTRILAAQPDLAIEVAKSRLKPIPAAEAERVARWIRELDDDSADVRDKAQADLQDAGRGFESAIAAALKAAPPGEVHNRLTSALRKMATAGPPAELTTGLRGIAFLKALDTPGAKEHLKTLAAGAPGARLTAEAAAALGPPK